MSELESDKSFLKRYGIDFKVEDREEGFDKTRFVLEFNVDSRVQGGSYWSSPNYAGATIGRYDKDGTMLECY